MSTRVCLEFSQEQQQMLRLAMEGDREALGKLFIRDMRRLYRTALYILASPEDAEDAVQHGFLSALCNLHQFEGRARFSTG